MIRTLIFLSNFLLAGCIATTGIPPLPLTIDESTHTSDPEGAFVSRFLKACIYKEDTPEGFPWEPASSVALEKLNLSKLRRKVLEIPGGGAPVSETQALFVSEKAPGLVLERVTVTSRGSPAEGRCSLYGDRDFLPSCSKLGKALERPPNRNTRYENTGAHFINWQGSQDGRQISIECATTPQSVTLPYEGTQLTMRSSAQSAPTKRLRANPVSSAARRRTTR